MTELIGGHEGLDVYRDGERIVKVAKDPANALGLRREAEFLELFAGTPWVPKLLEAGGSEIVEENVGPTLRDGAAIEDGEVFRRNCANLLAALRSRRVRNGDLTAPNIAVRPGDFPCAVDWQQSHRFDEPFPDRQTSDSFLLLRELTLHPARRHSVPDTPRVARRWIAVLGDLGGLAGTENLAGKTLLDLGCFLGDFCGLAAAEGMAATGVDRGGFDPAFDSIVAARKLWPDAVFWQGDIVDFEARGHDAVLLFSTWPYVLRDHGRTVADALVRQLVAENGRLYFETQLAGDGPGPAFFVDDGDVLGYLSQFGVPQPLATIPVTGRDASRTVWRVVRA